MLRDSRDIIRRLRRDGFELISISGSHHKFRHPVTKRTTIVTHPRKDIPIGTVKSIYRDAGLKEPAMTYYIALIHKDPDSCYGVSFPDIPGVFTAGDTIDEAMQQAAEVLVFAAEDWTNPDGSTGLPAPRTIDELRNDAKFNDMAEGAVVAAVPFRMRAHAAE